MKGMGEKQSARYRSESRERTRTGSVRVDELTIIKLAIRVAPAAVAAIILLDLLVDEYLRLMELAGLARRRSGTEHASAEVQSDVERNRTEKVRPAR